MVTQCRRRIVLLTLLGLTCVSSCGISGKAAADPGKPYEDVQYQGGPQRIPGKVQCEFFNFGGEGIAFHDTDSVNLGSGRLNSPDGSYLHEFRKEEAVDISYIKFRTPPIDNSDYNFVTPEKNQLYVGWTEVGEWLAYTLKVERTGTYRVGLMYTSRHGGQITLSVNGKERTGALSVPSTFVQADPVAWRQWHHWNYIGDLVEMKLEKGLQKLTLHTVEKGQMNYDYLYFEFVE